MKILDRLAVPDKPYHSEFRGERVKIRPFQIIVHVSLSDIPIWDPRTPLIPALLDTGNNHNFSIQEHQLVRWAKERIHVKEHLTELAKEAKRQRPTEG
jgi:hypothetical protein